jgi:hypothetical protein
MFKFISIMRKMQKEMHPGLLIFLLQCFNEMRMRVGVGGEQVE